MTFYLGDIDNIIQVKVYVNITNDITSGKMQSAQHNSMQIQVRVKVLGSLPKSDPALLV